MNACAIAWAELIWHLGFSYGLRTGYGGSRFFLAKEIINKDYQIKVVPDTDLGFDL